MQGYLSLILHAHLPFVRHPEHEKFLEESWLYEAITESYIPLLQILEGWHADGVKSRLALTLTPTLCAMLRDELLQSRYVRHLDQLIHLAEKELLRTHWEPATHRLAEFYHERLNGIREFYRSCEGNLVEKLRESQERGQLEIITSAATHALLPLMANHPGSLRAQILTGRDDYRACFGRDPLGIWLPECAYIEGLETVLAEANLRWFVLDAHGILNASPKPRYTIFAPVLTANGVAAFGRESDSAREVWSRDQGYPGDRRYRDFYRDIGFDLDLDYIKPYLPAPDHRGFTGIKYHRITNRTAHKEIYRRDEALQAADEHAASFLQARIAEIERVASILGRPPIIVAPFDAELFGHWWYEGPEFLNFFVRKAWFDQKVLSLITPGDYLRLHPETQQATPAASSWGEQGYYRVWLNENNEWIYPHLEVAEQRMCELARRNLNPRGLKRRALNQAGRELLLAQASDWPFILKSGAAAEYARQRVTTHLLQFTTLHSQIKQGKIDENSLRQVEATDNIFPEIDIGYWKSP
jgi:1,4-alpha-glucan branching enzyme